MGKFTRRTAEVSLGVTYNRLTVKAIVYKVPPEGGLKAWATADCSCGGEHSTWLHNIRRGTAKGCKSCHAMRLSAAKKAMEHDPAKVAAIEYGIFSAMRGRCLNPNNPAWHNYGGRGITLDPRWTTFEAFLSDMGPRPFKEFTLERVNNDKGYGPNNCIWATRKTQSRNNRRNRLLTCRGTTMILLDWAQWLGVCRGTVGYNIRKYGSAERAIEALAKQRGLILPNAASA
jgi:hypothetical protein